MNRDQHTLRLMAAARRLGIAVEDLHDRWLVDAVRLSHGGREEYVFDGRNFSSLTDQAHELCRNKQACKDLMAESGLPVPASLIFDQYDRYQAAIGRFLERHRPAVVKPLDAAHGRAVQMGIESPIQVERYFAKHRHDDPLFLLEEQVAGEDLRMLAIGGELVAACTRSPARVTGDGVRTVAALIVERNAVIASQNPANRIEVDQQVEDLLDEQGMTLHAVVPSGLGVQLKRVANLAQGGSVVDRTDAIHPTYRDWVRRAGDRLRLRIFSLDVITTDPARDPVTHAKFLELNSKSDWLHHTFSEGRQHDIPTMILRDLFGISAASG